MDVLAVKLGITGLSCLSGVSWAADDVIDRSSAHAAVNVLTCEWQQSEA
jgi:hypothetical protein